MTFCVQYVGDLDDPTFDAEGGDWNGNTPARLSPEFPPLGTRGNAGFHDWVEASGVECIQTDFGAWVARVTKSQILEYITQSYAGDEELPWVKGQLEPLKELVLTLEDDHIYGLVATEY